MMMKFVVFVAVLAYASAEETQKKAVVKIVGNGIAGNVTFIQKEDNVEILGVITGLTEGEHGFHIHTTGDVTNDCQSVGAHFNPHKVLHGGPNDTVRHVGDLGNIKANAKGEAEINATDKVISLSGKHNIIGRALVIHSAKDDLGKGTAETSNTTGDAGDKIACGVIGVLVESSSAIQILSNLLTVGILISILNVIV